MRKRPGKTQAANSRYGTFEEVARRTQLDRRTVKKYILAAEKGE